MQLSVIIPVFNGAATLSRCLAALAQSRRAPNEYIVVDDGSTDSSKVVAKQFGASVISTGGRFGPARARNLGARMASGELLIFIDADVAVHPEALERIGERFEWEPDLDALMGAYDDSPADPGSVSQFKNLMHSFFHRHGKPQAFSFWCGCGAVKRKVFLEHGGLDESYERPAIEDIEFGFRLWKSGGKLALDPQIQCKHLKAWALWSLVQTDIFQRGIPWMELILRTRYLPDDLNLGWRQRICVALSGLLALVCGLTAWQATTGQRLAPVAACMSSGAAILVLIVILNRSFYVFLAARQGWSFLLLALPLHIVYYFYNGASFLLGFGSYFLGALGRTTASRAVPLKRGEDQS